MKTLVEFMKLHKLLTGFLIGAVCILVTAGILFACNEAYIVFNVAEEQVIQLEYGKDTEPPKVTALYKERIFNREGTEIPITMAGELDLETVGTYFVDYTAEFKNVKGKVGIAIEVVDTQAPEIALVSSPEHYTSPVGVYEEEGFTAIDNYDGDITSSVTSEEKDGVVIYKVADSSGNETVVERTIVYKDVIAPVITLKGKKSITLNVGDSYKEPGFSAEDECDGDISKAVSVDGEVNTKKAGTYVVSYTVKDSSGNESTVERTIKVKKAIEVIPGDKVVYLTFDDGPGPYTERLLDILDKYNVKVTFFVTGMKPEYYDLIGEAYRRGHTIALHTYSHVYSKVYSSKEAYYKDLEKIKKVVVEQIGEEPTLVRFPGGTSNTTSRKYCKGIMTYLSKNIGKKGYQYCDWNVSSGDAGETTSEQGVFNNVINGISTKKHSIVLQHDIKSFSVEAVDDIIEWGLANGYTFKAMDEDTKMTQHNPLN